jgi:hypothetical protein
MGKINQGLASLYALVVDHTRASPGLECGKDLVVSTTSCHDRGGAGLHPYVEDVPGVATNVKTHAFVFCCFECGGGGSSVARSRREVQVRSLFSTRLSQIQLAPASELELSRSTLRPHVATKVCTPA